MISDNVNLDWGADLEDNNYKSCFARSVAVNSQYKQIKPEKQQLLVEEKLQKGDDKLAPKPVGPLFMEGVKMRKVRARIKLALYVTICII